MERIVSIIGVCLFIITSVKAQVNISAPSSVNAMVDSYVMKNRQQDEIQGWRIQVVATTDRRLMETTKSKFRSYFPQIHSSWTHNAPYYQFQAGAFFDKKEALPVLAEVKNKFPKAYLVVDRISYEELNKQL